MIQLKNTRANLLALGAKRNQGLEQKLLEEMESLEDVLKIRFWIKIQKAGLNECWEWRGERIKGYGRLFILGRPMRAHRISYLLNYKKLIPNGMYVCHACDNKGCVNPNHLWVGTNKENQIDASKKGRTFLRSQKLTPAQVLEIRQLIVLGHPERQLAKQYGIHWAHVNHIKHRHVWKYI